MGFVDSRRPGSVLRCGEIIEDLFRYFPRVLQKSAQCTPKSFFFFHVECATNSSIYSKNPQNTYARSMNQNRPFLSEKCLQCKTGTILSQQYLYLNRKGLLAFWISNLSLSLLAEKGHRVSASSVLSPTMLSQF